MTDLSIIIVTWNTRDLVLACLASIDREMRTRSGQNRLVTETLVIDNGSSDGTAEAILERYPWARLIRLERNVGYAAGCNAGLRHMRGRYALLLNSDTRAVRGALEYCVSYLDRHKDVGIVGPQLLNPDGSKQNSVHNYPIVATELVPKGVFQFLFRKRFPSRRWTGEEPIDVEAVAGAALFLRAKLLEEVGSLPEEYFFFLEETDWCWRVREAGWRVVHLPTAHVMHLSGGSSKRKHPSLTRIEYHRSLYRFFLNRHGALGKAVVLLLRFAKSFFYVVTQAPLALAGGRHLARWKTHLRVFAWHLRGCPTTVGFATIGPEELAAALDAGPGASLDVVPVDGQRGTPAGKTAVG